MINDNYTGWIKLHRSILEWEWWDDRNARDLFIYCLLKANHEDVKWHGQIIERGTFITSRDELAKKTGLTIQQTRTALEKLISTSEITKQTTNKITIITICNYDKYQELQPIEQPTEQPDNQPTNNQQITNKQPTNNHKQEYKEGEEIKKYNIPPYNPPHRGRETQTHTQGFRPSYPRRGCSLLPGTQQRHRPTGLHRLLRLLRLDGRQQTHEGLESCRPHLGKQTQSQPSSTADFGW